jgi:hypothetical protein
MIETKNGFKYDREHPFWRFGGGGPKKAAIPPAPPPAPTPESIDEGALEAGERERRLAKRRKGRRGTILTEDVLGGTQVERQSLLGNTGA